MFTLNSSRCHKPIPYPVQWKISGMKIVLDISFPSISPIASEITYLIINNVNVNNVNLMFNLKKSNILLKGPNMPIDQYFTLLNRYLKL